MIKKLKPCPKCGSSHIIPRIPIKLYSKDFLFKGPCYFMCFNCAHKGPSIDYSDRTASDVNQNKEIYEEMKELWNNQRKGLVI